MVLRVSAAKIPELVGICRKSDFLEINRSIFDGLKLIQPVKQTLISLPGDSGINGHKWVDISYLGQS